jgi:hypothetical protein
MSDAASERVSESASQRISAPANPNPHQERRFANYYEPEFVTPG